jgi:V8-like Glu-specific endopeptidase
MNKTKTRAIFFTLIISLAILIMPAYAITGNTHADNTHSFVGIVVFYELDANGSILPMSICSGVLISPTIMITTAHGCLTSNVLVSFDQGPITWGVQDGQLQINGVTTLYEGTAYPHPQFTMAAQGSIGDFMHNDLAVIVLDEPVPENVVSSYGQLPVLGALDKLPRTDVTLVGYGFQSETATYIMRNYAFATTVPGGLAWSEEYLRCSANVGDGRGGICTGDSGGPVLLGQSNVVIALNSYAINDNFVGVTYHVRLDTEQALNWIMEVENYEAS